MDEKGEPAGFNVDITRAIAEKMNIDIEIRIEPWSEILRELEEGDIDVVSGMYYSLERDKEFDFSMPYTIVEHTVFAHSGTKKISTEEELIGKRVIVMRGDIMHDYVLEKGISLDPVVVSTQAEALKLLASGDNGYALLSEFTGEYWIDKLGLSDICVAGPVLLPAKYCYGAKHMNKELLHKFNEGLAILEQTGQYARIYEKWLGVFKEKWFYYNDVTRYSLMTLAILFIFLVFFTVWNRMLRMQVSQRTLALKKELDEHKKLERQIMMAKERYKSLTSVMTSVVWSADAKGRFVAPQKKWEDFTGQSWDEHKGWGWIDALHLKDRDKIKKSLIEAFEKKEVYHSEGRVIRPNGEYSYCEICAVPVYDGKNEFFEWVGTVTDITERKELEKMKNLLIRDTSHTLKTPISMAKMASDWIILASENGDKKTLGEMYNILSRNLESAQKIISNILLVYSLEDTSVRKEKKEVSIKETVKEILALYEEDIKNKDINVRLDVSPDAAKVRSIPGEILLLLGNLIDNAFKFTEKGNITIRTEIDGGYVKIEVADTGRGISINDKDIVFKKFYQRHPTVEGVGLGLSICRAIVRRHNGSIEIVSAGEGKGVKVIVKLPVVKNKGKET